MTKECYPTSFFAEAFRIVCWQLNEFSRQRAETLRPDRFDCNRCDKPEKNTAKGCPKCELMTMQEYYETQIKSQVLRFCGAWPKGITLAHLLQTHGDIAALVGRRKTVKKRWSVRVARLARIYISEQNQQRAISDFESLQKMRQITQANGGNSGVQVTQIVRRQNA